MCFRFADVRGYNICLCAMSQINLLYIHTQNIIEKSHKYNAKLIIKDKKNLKAVKNFELYCIMN